MNGKRGKRVDTFGCSVDSKIQKSFFSLSVEIISIIPNEEKIVDGKKFVLTITHANKSIYCDKCLSPVVPTLFRKRLSPGVITRRDLRPFTLLPQRLSLALLPRLLPTSRCRGSPVLRILFPKRFLLPKKPRFLNLKKQARLLPSPNRNP